MTYKIPQYTWTRLKADQCAITLHLGTTVVHRFKCLLSQSLKDKNVYSEGRFGIPRIFNSNHFQPCAICTSSLAALRYVSHLVSDMQQMTYAKEGPENKLEF